MTRIIFRLPTYNAGDPAPTPIRQSSRERLQRTKAEASVEALLLATTEALGLTRHRALLIRQSGTPILATASQFGRFIVLRLAHAERLGAGTPRVDALKPRIIEDGERIEAPDPLDLTPDRDVDAPVSRRLRVTLSPLEDPYAYQVAVHLSKVGQHTALRHNLFSRALRERSAITMTPDQLADLLASDAWNLAVGAGAASPLVVPAGPPSPRVIDVTGSCPTTDRISDEPIRRGDRVQVGLDWGTGSMSARHVATAIEDIRAGEGVVVERSALAQGLVAKRAV